MTRTVKVGVHIFRRRIRVSKQLGFLRSVNQCGYIRAKQNSKEHMKSLPSFLKEAGMRFFKRINLGRFVFNSR